MRQRFRKKSTLARLVPGAIVYPLLGAALVLPTVALWMSLGPVAAALPRDARSWAPILGGALAYVLVHVAFRRPIALYVFGHELTHALAALLSGYKVKSLFVSEKGGEVELSDTNVVVALAPYCVPLYTAAVVAVYLVVDHYAGFSRPPVWFGVGVGATSAFHVALTVYALRQHQPDLRHAGVFFSWVAILFCNTLSLVGLAALLFPSSVDARALWRNALGRTRDLTEGLAAFARDGGRRAVEAIERTP